jgi:hypothetical protein
MTRATDRARVAVVGKYVELKDSYISIREALTHAAIAENVALSVDWISSESIAEKDPDSILRGVDGIVIPGGFGDRGVEGKIEAAGYAREKRIPCFGLCLGMQCMAIEYARGVLGLKSAHSHEFDAETPDPVIALLEEQEPSERRMRLGAYDAVRGTISLRSGHDRRAPRHRYEFNPAIPRAIREGRMKIAGTSPDGKLVEILELPGHLVVRRSPVSSGVHIPLPRSTPSSEASSAHAETTPPPRNARRRDDRRHPAVHPHAGPAPGPSRPTAATNLVLRGYDAGGVTWEATADRGELATEASALSEIVLRIFDGAGTTVRVSAQSLAEEAGAVTLRGDVRGETDDDLRLSTESMTWTESREPESGPTLLTMGTDELSAGACVRHAAATGRARRRPRHVRRASTFVFSSDRGEVSDDEVTLAGGVRVSASEPGFELQADSLIATAEGWTAKGGVSADIELSAREEVDDGA